MLIILSKTQTQFRICQYVLVSTSVCKYMIYILVCTGMYWYVPCTIIFYIYCIYQYVLYQGPYIFHVVGQYSDV